MARRSARPLVASPLAAGLGAAGLLAGVLIAAAPGAAREPSAFELLARLRATAAGVDAYRDRGVIEIGPAVGPPVRTVAFETVAGPDGSFRLVLGEGERVVWRQPTGEVSQYDASRSRYRRRDSLAAAIYHDLGEIGPALVVARVLAGDLQAIPEPEAAALERTTTCGDSTCAVVVFSRLLDSERYRLWIDPASGLLRRLELERPAGRVAFRRALAGAGLDPAAVGSEPAPALVVTVHHREVAVGDAALGHSAAFSPPADARLAREEGGAKPAPQLGARPAGRPEAGWDAEITVRLASTVVRVVDGAGGVVRGLGPDAFRLTVGGSEVAVESVDWVEPGAGAPPPAEELAAAGVVLPAERRTLVLFVQADMHPSRMSGQLRLLDEVWPLVDGLARDDLLAVLSFHSHLDLHLDFVRDPGRRRGAIAAALEGAVRRLDPAPAPAPTPGVGVPPRLAVRLDPREARRAATPERALELVGRALEHLPGEKDLVILGWGLGRFGREGFRTTPAFERALAALREARVTASVLDVSDADYHSLEQGLRILARETGGTYQKTHLFTGAAVDRVAAAIAGHYVLYYRPPSGRAAGDGQVQVRLAGRDGRVLAAE